VKYKLFSDATNVISSATLNQPVLLLGFGKIEILRCTLGVRSSPFFLNGYMHIEARGPNSKILIEDGVKINNNAVIIADSSTITIHKNTLIGSEFCVYDSDFHELNPQARLSKNYTSSSVRIGSNVFIGSRVIVLKGSSIGDNTVIACGSVVAGDVPSFVVAGGIPAKVIRKL
jgi:maltose O-acetyltransferase